MTSVPHKIIRFFAPDECALCSKDNNVLCNACLHNLPIIEEPACCLCGQPEPGWRVCDRCLTATRLTWIQALYSYDTTITKLITKLKFERQRDVAFPLARHLATLLPNLKNWLVVPIPTAPNRVRQRGYDQAVLIAKEVAACKDLPYYSALGRLVDSRQLGANRGTRRQQAEQLFYVKQPTRINNRNILLIDDVCTTGATLSAAAEVLHKSGAKNIAAAAIAWKR